MTPKEEFLAIFQENVSREGAADLAAWLETTDFFTAPASTRYHCACEGGLVLHSLSVYHTLMERYFEEGVDSRESFAIVALLHDLCNGVRVLFRAEHVDHLDAVHVEPVQCVEERGRITDGEQAWR